MTHRPAPSNSDLTPTLSAVAAAVGAPDFVIPWLDRFYDEDDVRAVFATPEAAEGEEGPSAAPARTGDLPDGALERAVRRAVLDVDESGVHAPASFADRLDIWAMFEGWGDMPGDVRARLADWATDDYAASVRDDLEALKTGAPVDSREVDYTYLLLPEAEAVIDAEAYVYLWPCDCRAIVGGCDKPVEVCLRFDNERGLGREIAKDEAVRILRATDAAGLMHTDYLGREPGDEHAICNCCTDCCFPHRAARQLGAEAVWPHRRHVAAIDADVCEPCGLCALRCPFGAITSDSVGRPRLEPSACRGCGLCSTTCPTDAIEMEPLGTPA